MDDSDRPALAGVLYALGEAFNEPVSGVRAEAYFDALCDLPLETVRGACRQALKTAKFFPRPVEIRECAAGPFVDEAELAWLEMQREVRRVGYTGVPRWSNEATRRAAMELYGGWQALCERLPSAGPELLGCRKYFQAIYGAYARTDAREGRPDAHHLQAPTAARRLAAPIERPLSAEEAADALERVVRPVLRLIPKADPRPPKELATPPKINTRTLDQIAAWRRSQEPQGTG